MKFVDYFQTLLNKVSAKILYLLYIMIQFTLKFK